MHKLLTSGRTDLLEHFVSNRTRRKFKAYLRYDPQEGKVVFEFEPRRERAGKAPPEGAAASKAAPERAPEAGQKAVAAKKTAARKAPAKKAARKRTP